MSGFKRKYLRDFHFLPSSDRLQVEETFVSRSTLATFPRKLLQMLFTQLLQQLLLWCWPHLKDNKQSFFHSMIICVILFVGILVLLWYKWKRPCSLVPLQLSRQVKRNYCGMLMAHTHTHTVYKSHVCCAVPQLDSVGLVYLMMETYVRHVELLGFEKRSFPSQHYVRLNSFTLPTKTSAEKS